MDTVLTPPDDLAEDTLRSALARHWGVTVASIGYRAVGYGSHHWEVTDVEGGRWFVTVDELETKRPARDAPLSAGFDLLHASLAAARRLRDYGREFVVAPVATRDGAPVARLRDRFGVALYPYVAGRSFGWGEWESAAHRRAVLDLVIAVHSAPAEARRHAIADDFAVPHRDELEAALGSDAIPERGPYSQATAELLREHAAPLQTLLARYDALVADARVRAGRAVLTHGEPHPGNTMLTSDGWRLIDWDTVLIAPPERDLWLIDPGDGSLLAAYADATGLTPLPEMLRLYRLRWDLADIAVEVSRFQRRHTGSDEDAASWRILRSVIAEMSAGASA